MTNLTFLSMFLRKLSAKTLVQFSAVFTLLCTLGTTNVWGTTFTTTSSGGFSNGSKTIDGITVTFGGAVSWQSGHVRVYQSNTISFSCSSNITEIVMNCSQGARDFNASTGECSTTGSAITWTGSATNITLTLPNGSQVRITSIVVTTGSSCSTPPTVGASGNSSISVTGATVSCTGITKGDCDIDEWGFFYKTGSSGVTTSDTKVQVSAAKSTTNVSSFNKSFTELNPNTHYYFAAYAKVGSNYYLSSETDFTTKTLTSSSSNTTYGTVSRSGRVITGSLKSGGSYGSPAYTVTGASEGSTTTVEREGNRFTVTSNSTSNIIVTINFEAKGCTDHADEDLTNGATSSADYGPIHAFYDYSVSQILYTRDDLGLSASTKKGTVKSIYFEYSGAAAMSDRSIVIYMANTSQDALATDDYVPYSVFTKVYEGTFGCSSTGWYEIEFDTEFKYDGLGNLVVMIDDNTNDYQSSKTFKSHSASGMQIYQRRDDSDIDPRSWSPATSPSYRPNTKFCIQEEDMEMYTVSFSTGTGNDGVSPMTEEDYGEGILLPNGPTPDCADDGWVFAGWSETEYTTEPYVTNVGRLLMPGDYFYPDEDVTLYAVYRKLTTGTSTATYTANSRGNLSVIGAYYSEYWWYHTSTGVEFYINNYGIDNNKFDLYNSEGGANSDGWALIDAHRPITEISLTVTSGTPYASLSSTEPDAGTVTLDGSTITCTGNVTKVVVETSTTQKSEVYLSAFTVTYKNCEFFSNPTCCTKHDITLASSGSVTGGTFTTSAASACEGTEVTLTATPSDGYAFAGWTVTNTSGGADVTNAVLGAGHAGDNPATMTMPEQAVTVNATFATLTGITVKTAPTKTTYCEGDYFDPTGLVITASFSNSTSLDIPYAGNEAKFTFSPTTSTALTTGNSSVSISYGGQSTSQAITVNAHLTISLTGSGTVTGGTFTADESSACVGATITIEASAADHYSFNSWTIEKAGGGTVTPVSATSASTTFIMPDANVTVTASFNEDAYKTVCFKNNGVGIAGYTTQKVYVGESPVAPTLTDGTSGDACDETSDTHYGWTQTTMPDVVPSKATIDAYTGAQTVYAKAATLPAITAGDDGTTLTYHAVWAEGVGVPSNEWQLVTSTSSLETGDKVVIGHNNTGTIWLLGYQYITPDATDAKRYYNRKYASNTETVSDSKITLTSDEIATAIGNTSKPYVLTIGKSGDYWTFYDDVYEGYLYAAGTNDALDVEFYDKNLLNCQAVLTNAGKWELTINGSTGAATIVSQTTSGTTRKNLQRNGTDAGGVFSCYPSQTDPYIYKNLSTTGYQNFLTTCCANIVEAPEVTGTPTKNSITLSWTNVTGATGYTVTSSGGTPGDVSSDGTARSCVITGLSPNTNYTWSVVATYTTPYCLANTANGNTTTSQVYAVSYNKNGGTIANLPSGGTYAAGEEVTVAAKPDGTVSKGGYTFTGWNTANDGSGEHYDADGSTTFDMPSENVVLYAEWTAKKNYFIDRMHGNWDEEHTEPTTGYNCYLREGAGYTVPDLSDNDTGSNSCVSGHAHFVGWVASGNIDAQGGLKSGYTIIKGGTSGTASVDGTIYYAVWAEE